MTSIDPHLAARCHAALPESVRQHLHARGISDPVIDRAELGWNGTRITIPVSDRAGQLAFFKLGKAPDDTGTGPKMLCFPAGVRAELYGWDTLSRGPGFVILCEGEYDRLVLESRGFPAVTGTGGAGVFRPEWAEALRAIPTVYVCFDNDEAGREGAERVSRLLPDAKIVTLPDEVGPSGDVTDFFVRLGHAPADFHPLLDAAEPLPPEAPPLRPEPLTLAPRSEVRQLKQAVRIEAVIGQHLELRPSGRAFMGRCPFHQDQEPSLAVFPETQRFYCFGCARHGDVITFLREAEGLSFGEALEALRRLAATP